MGNNINRYAYHCGDGKIITLSEDRIIGLYDKYAHNDEEFIAEFGNTIHNAEEYIAHMCNMGLMHRIYSFEA